VEEEALISLSPPGRAVHKTVVFFFGYGRFAARVRVSVLVRHRGHAMPTKGLPMALHVHTTHPDAPDEPAADRLGALYPDWSEHIVTIVTASLAVLIVALIAVVMGMA
jgi:hypothetical protein